MTQPNGDHSSLEISRSRLQLWTPRLLLALQLAQLLPAAVAGSASREMQAFPLPGLACIDGSTPVVWAGASSTVTEWVIQIGSQSITTSFCISPFHCKLFAAPQPKPAPTPPPMVVSNAGMGIWVNDTLEEWALLFRNNHIIE